MEILILLFVLCFTCVSARLTPESQFISEIDYPDGNQIIFREEGTVANQLGFLHVKAQLDIGAVFKDIITLNNTIQEMIDKKYARYRATPDGVKFDSYLTSKNSSLNEKAMKEAQAKFHSSVYSDNLVILINIKKRLMGLHKELRDAVIPLPSPKDETNHYKNLFHNRFRRFLHREERDIISSFLFGLPGTIMGILNRSQINSLVAKTDKIGKTVNNLVDIVDVQSTALRDVTIDLDLSKDMIYTLGFTTMNSIKVMSTCEVFFQHLQTVIGKITRSIDSSNSHRLSSRVLDGDVLHGLFKYLKARAAQENQDTFLDHPSDLFQIDTSYLYEAESNIFTLILHVPMVPENQELELRKYLPFPLVESQKLNATIVPEIGAHIYLASNEKQQFRIMTQADLASCVKRGDLHLCLGRNSLHKQLLTTCLGSLFLKDMTSVRTTCSFKLETPLEHVIATNPSEWLIYSVYGQNPTATCLSSGKKALPEKIPIRGQTVLKLRPGCSLDLQTEVLTSDYSEDKNAIISLFDWKFNESLLSFNDVTPEEVAKKVQLLRSIGTKIFNAQDLQHLKVDLSSSTSWWDYLTYFSIGLLAVLVIIFLLWCFCCKKRMAASSTAFQIALGGLGGFGQNMGHGEQQYPQAPRASRPRKIFGGKAGFGGLSLRRKKTKIPRRSEIPTSTPESSSNNLIMHSDETPVSYDRLVPVNSMTYAYVNEKKAYPSRRQ